MRDPGPTLAQPHFQQEPQMPGDPKLRLCIWGCHNSAGRFRVYMSRIVSATPWPATEGFTRYIR